MIVYMHKDNMLLNCTDVKNKQTINQIMFEKYKFKKIKSELI